MKFYVLFLYVIFMSKAQIEKLLNFPRSRDNAYCCRIIDLYNEIVREMNHFYGRY